MQTCPRRMTEFGGWERQEGIDEWMESPRREGELIPFCSFCGSLNPERFLELVADGWSVGPTDKNYKAYLRQAFTIPSDRAIASGAPLPEPVRHIQSKFYYQHFSSEQQRRFIDLYNGGSMRIGEPGYFYVLPFFMMIDPGSAQSGQAE